LGDAPACVNRAGGARNSRFGNAVAQFISERVAWHGNPASLILRLTADQVM